MKELFFNIWHDDMGTGWILLIFLLFLLCLILLIVYFVLIETKTIKFNRLHLIFLSLIAIIIYQIVPVSIDFCASVNYMFKINKSVVNDIKIDKNALDKLIKIEKVAIKTSIIPWQKGGYYCKLANLYLSNHEYNKAFEAYETAYKHLKSYSCPCWGISYIVFYNKKDYDTAIEIAKNTKKLPTNLFISQCYIKKGDIKNAELYVDKAIKEGKRLYPTTLATKAYILKAKGSKKEALEYYQKAKQLCKKDKEKERVNNIYKDFIEYDNKRLSKIRKQWGVEP